MKLISLRMSGYRQFLEETTLFFPEGLTGICGPNGVGKSKIVEAIGYALYGPNKKILPDGDKKGDLPSRARPGSRQEVELVLEVRRQQYRITRTDGTALITHYDPATGGEGPKLADTPSGVTAKVIELLRLTPQAFVGTFVARQNHIAGLQTMPEMKRYELVNRLIGITAVEQALKLSHSVCLEKQADYRVSQAGIRKTVEQATQELEIAEDAVEAAEREEVRLRGHHEGAQQALEKARSARDTLKEEAQEGASLKEQLEAQSDHRQTLCEQRQSALARLRAAQLARRHLALVMPFLVQRGRVEVRLSNFTRLTQIAALKAAQARIQEDLATRVDPGCTRLGELDHAIRELDRALNDANEALTKYVGQKASAEQEMNQEEKIATHMNQHRTKAEDLGPDGPCETCGQKFGNNLGKAIARYKIEEASALERAEQARDRMISAGNEIDRLKQQIDNLNAKRNGYVEERTTYANFPGEASHFRRAVATIATQLVTYPISLLHSTYDARAHELAKQQVVRIEQAEATLLRLEPQLSLGEEILEELVSIDTKLATLQELQQEITIRLNNAERAVVAVEAAEAVLTAADVAEQAARASAQTAYGELVNARALRKQAEGELEDAQQRESDVKKAGRALAVADYTHQAMDRMVQELTQEAGPILCDYMRTWADSLLGSRFRKITLSPRYRILADNGSGEHRIEHFSGGEQTLLALMLRVAISLFCQQRANFDKGFLVLDEIFGNQDSERRNLLLQFLEDIRPNYHQILLVNHVEDVSDALDNIIDVSRPDPNANISTAVLRTAL